MPPSPISLIIFLMPIIIQGDLPPRTPRIAEEIAHGSPPCGYAAFAAVADDCLSDCPFFAMAK